MTPRYRHVVVPMVGQDGNAFAIIGRVGDALRRQCGQEVAKEWYETATRAVSYDALLDLVMQTVEVS